MIDCPREVTVTEYLPCLAESLVDPERVSVRFDIDASGGTLDFIMVDTTDWPPGSHGRAVTKDPDGNICLVVERGKDRIFAFSLSPAWRWTFDQTQNQQGDPITFKRGDAPLYKVRVLSPTELEIEAKARPNMPTGGARDYFNIHVLMEQDSGSPVALRIDPITDNPPSRP